VRGEERNLARILRWLVAMALAGWLASGFAQQVEVITLNYRTADQVVPILKPLLAPGGTISGMQNRIVVRTTPENLAELRQVLDAIDAAPRRLLISVRQDAAGQSTRNEAEISGSVGGGGVRATVPGSASNEGGTVVLRRGDDRVKGRALESRSTASDRSVQTLQVMEGNEAWINVGQSVSVQDGGVTGGTYRDIGTGFRVKPRVSGKNVTLEISTQRDSIADAGSGNVDVQRVDTIVTGRLGEWMQLGGVAQQNSRTDRGTVSRSTSTGADDRSVYLKVDEIR
jgi:type II secretory pathway component GspD/PulD (secretin)